MFQHIGLIICKHGTHTHTHTHTHNNLKLYKSKEGKTITTFYTFCVKLSDEREKKRKNKTYKEVFKVA